MLVQWRSMSEMYIASPLCGLDTIVTFACYRNCDLDCTWPDIWNRHAFPGRRRHEIYMIYNSLRELSGKITTFIATLLNCGNWHNLVRVLFSNGLLPESNWTPSRLCTFADYSKDTLWHLNLISLEMQNIITEMWPRQNLQTTFSNEFSWIKMFAILSIFRRTYSHGSNVLEKRNC